MPHSVSRRIASRLLHASLLALAGTSSLSATSLTLDIDPTRELNLYIKANGVEEYTTAGVLLITVDAAYQRVALCVDYFTPIDIGINYTTTFPTVNSINNGMRVAWLIENALAGATTQISGAALQLAIWEIVHDNGAGYLTNTEFSQGTIQAPTTVGNQWSAALLTAAHNYVVSAMGVGHTSQNAWVYVNFDPGLGQNVQTLMSPVYPTGAPAPEASSLLLVISGAAFLARNRRAISSRLASAE